MSIFSPPTDDKTTPFAESSGFQGKISHHGPGKPFKDGYSGSKAAAGASTTTPVATEEQEADGKAGGGVGAYVGEALERVVSTSARLLFYLVVLHCVIYMYNSITSCPVRALLGPIKNTLAWFCWQVCCCSLSLRFSGTYV